MSLIITILYIVSVTQGPNLQTLPHMTRSIEISGTICSSKGWQVWVLMPASAWHKSRWRMTKGSLNAFQNRNGFRHILKCFPESASKGLLVLMWYKWACIQGSIVLCRGNSWGSSIQNSEKLGKASSVSICSGGKENEEWALWSNFCPTF